MIFRPLDGRSFSDYLWLFQNAYILCGCIYYIILRPAYLRRSSQSARHGNIDAIGGKRGERRSDDVHLLGSKDEELGCEGNRVTTSDVSGKDHAAEPHQQQSASASGGSPVDAAIKAAEDRIAAREVHRCAESEGPSTSPESPGEGTDVIVASPPQQPSRFWFLDRLKVVLTVFVVIHHVACACYAPVWGGPVMIFGSTKGVLEGNYDTFFTKVFAPWFLNLQQAYFMSLFFFISAYFTPGSWDRKGKSDFLADKFKRLGWPFMFYNVVLGPVTWVVMCAIFDVPFPGYDLVGGPPWFVGWLLTFNVFYAYLSYDVVDASDNVPIKAVGSEHHVTPIPGVGSWLAIGLALGIAASVYPWKDFVAMPGGFRSAIIYIPCFYAGVVTKRMGWLYQLQSICRSSSLFLAGIVTLISVALFGIQLQEAYATDPSLAADYTKDMDVLKGPFCVAIMMLFLWGFQEYFNKPPSAMMKACARSAYTVYIIHYFPLMLVQWLFYITMGSANADAAQEYPLSRYSTNKEVLGSSLYYIVIVENPELWSFISWLIQSVLTNMIVWPVSYVICNLPILRSVL